MGFFNNLFGQKKQNKDFVPSSELMDEDQFWDIVKITFEKSSGNFENQQNELYKLLKRTKLQDIILFDNKFRELRGKANFYELWGAIYIIHGGFGDDSFTDFRDWIISQGKEFYYKTLENPETLANVETERIEIDWEGMGYIPRQIFEDITGKEIASTFQENIETTGFDWEEEDLFTMFPKLIQKYPGNV